MSVTVRGMGLRTGRGRRRLVGSDFAGVAAGIELIAERLVESAGLRAGDAVLDVVTGTGDAAFAAAGRGCVVTAVDDAQARVGRDRNCARADALIVKFMEGDPEHLLYPDASFDAVLSCLGVMFTARHRPAARELLRVCRPGGTIALASWTPAGFVGRMFQTVAAYAQPPSLMWPPGLWGTREHLEQLLADGLDELTLTPREFVFRFRSHAEFVNALCDSCEPVRAAFEVLDQGGGERLYQELVALVAAHDREPGRSVAVPSEYLEAIAVVR